MSIASLFGQLNQAITNNPLATGTGTSLIDQMSQAGGGLMGGLLNQSPYDFMTPGARQMEGLQDLSKLDLGTAEGLEAASGVYGKMGNQNNQLQLAQAAAQQRAAQAERMKQQQLREAMARQYRELGMQGASERVLSGVSDIEEDQKALRELQREDLLIKRGLQGRKVLARMAGVDDAQFREMGLADLTDEQFSTAIRGFDADLKPFLGPDGQPQMLRVHSSGLVFDPSDQKFKEASAMGLTPAPQFQKVLNISNDMVQEFGKKTVDNYVALYEEANNAVGMLNNVNRALALVDNMVVGPGASARMFAERMAMAFGGDPNQAVSNSEQFLSESGMRVAEIIKNFGSGTGLSDDDRDYATKIAAGDITVTPAAIKKLLGIMKKGAEGTIDYFEQTDKSVRNTLKDEQYILNSFRLAPVEEVGEEPVLVWNPDTGRFE